MAYRLKISTANAMLEAIATAIPSSTSILEIYSGTIPTDADTATSGQTLLASITLPASAWAAASARSLAKSGTWQDASANAGSATPPTWFRLKNSGDTHRIDGTCAVGSGDLNFDGAITAGQVVTVSTFTVTI
jgi:hypothetical protein